MSQEVIGSRLLGIVGLFTRLQDGATTIFVDLSLVIPIYNHGFS